MNAMNAGNAGGGGGLSKILELLAKFGGVMLSTTEKGWCCHVINAERGINRHFHAATAKAAARRALKAMRKGDYNDEKPEDEE